MRHPWIISCRLNKGVPFKKTCFAYYTNFFFLSQRIRFHKTHIYTVCHLLLAIYLLFTRERNSRSRFFLAAECPGSIVSRARVAPRKKSKNKTQKKEKKKKKKREKDQQRCQTPLLGLKRFPPAPFLFVFCWPAQFESNEEVWTTHLNQGGGREPFQR